MIKNDYFLLIWGQKHDVLKLHLKLRILALFLGFFGQKSQYTNLKTTYLVSTRLGLSIGVWIVLARLQKNIRVFFGVATFRLQPVKF